MNNNNGNSNSNSNSNNRHEQHAEEEHIDDTGEDEAHDEQDSTDQHDTDTEEDSDDDDDDDDDDDSSSIESVVPTPEEVELEYTYPRDFQGRSWYDIVNDGQFFRLIIDPSCPGIPAEQFRRCKYLVEIVYPEGKNSKLLRIDRLAFQNCYNLQLMNPFPDGLMELGKYAFSDCWSLQGRITIPSSILFVRGLCFAGSKAITSVVFESSTATTTVLELEDYIFQFCKELLSVRLPNNLTVISRGCFDGCCLLIDVPIPRTVRTIRFGAFENCALSAVDLPERVIAIAGEAYCGCSSLVSVTIRSSSSNIQFGDNIFDGCSSLSIIKVYPWHFPKIFASMQRDSLFIYKFFHKYQYQILEDEAEIGVATRQHRNGRRRRRQRHPQKRQRLQGDDRK